MCTFCIAKRLLKTRCLLHKGLLIIFLVQLCLLAEITFSFGQEMSDQGNFTVDYVKGCAPLTVKAKNIFPVDSNDVPIVWNMNWDGNKDVIVIDSTKSTPNVQHTYTEPGTYKILQVISTYGLELDTITIEVLEPLAPTYHVYNCINNSIYIDFSKETYYDQYRIDYGDGTVDTVEVSDENATYQYVPGGSFPISVEGIFKGANSNCAVKDTTINTINDLEVASIQQVQVLSQQQIKLDFAFPNPDVAYQLEVGQNGDTAFAYATYELAGGANSITLNSLPDTRQNFYCFRIASVNKCDESLNLYSDTICSIALQATAGDLVNNLTWQTDTVDFTSFQILRDSGQIASASIPRYTDQDVICQQQYAYQVTTQKNGIASISEMINLTAVSMDTSLAMTSFAAKLSGRGVALSWDSAEVEAEQYYIYREGGGGVFQLYDSVSAQAGANGYQDDSVAVGNTYCYQLSYRDACGNESELSMQYCVEVPKKANVTFPTAFTPNGDGLNDVFIYKGNLIEQIELQIFNRWGELVFYTDQLDTGWDGRYKGVVAPQSTYIFKARIVDQRGNHFQQQGTFTLLIP